MCLWWRRHTICELPRHCVALSLGEVCLVLCCEVDYPKEEESWWWWWSMVGRSRIYGDQGMFWRCLLIDCPAKGVDVDFDVDVIIKV